MMWPRKEKWFFFNKKRFAWELRLHFPWLFDELSFFFVAFDFSAKKEIVTSFMSDTIFYVVRIFVTRKNWKMTYNKDIRRWANDIVVKLVAWLTVFQKLYNKKIHRHIDLDSSSSQSRHITEGRNKNCL